MHEQGLRQNNFDGIDEHFSQAFIGLKASHQIGLYLFNNKVIPIRKLIFPGTKINGRPLRIG